MNVALFKRIDVVRRVGEREVVVYRCFEVLSSGGFVVQSADRIRLPVEETRLRELTAQYWELVCEVDPDVRGIVASSLEEAISVFDADFE